MIEPIESETTVKRCPLRLDVSGAMDWGDRHADLSPAEARIVRELLTSRAVVTRRRLAMMAGTEVRRGLDAHIYRLRHKLSVFYNMELETVPKRGFRLNISKEISLAVAS
jgi:DNA-binding response OmpR family regulator